jgi:hypothetical protein
MNVNQMPRHSFSKCVLELNEAAYLRGYESQGRWSWLSGLGEAPSGSWRDSQRANAVH